MTTADPTRDILRRAGPRSPDVPWSTLAAISAGGVIGALARFGLATAFPHPAGSFAWTTFWINVSGCLLIGVLMVLVTDVWPGHRLQRPFLGTGVLRRAPHPHAAILFLDFMLSDAQKLLLDRDFMPTNMKVRPLQIPFKVIDPAQMLDEAEKWSKLYDQIVVKQGR